MKREEMNGETKISLTVETGGVSRTFTTAWVSDAPAQAVTQALVQVLGDEATRWINEAADEPPTPKIAWPGYIRRNAAALRMAYPDDLPRHPTGEVIVRHVRARMAWSADKAVPAVRAYLAGADLDNDA